MRAASSAAAATSASGGLHGVGISVVNALSTRMEIEVRRQGFHWTQTYIDQHPTAPLAQGKLAGDGESTGTSVTFWADPKIFETTVYDFETLRSHSPADGLPQPRPAHLSDPTCVKSTRRATR